MRLKAKIFELLELILEETNEGSKELAVDVMREFDTESATVSMNEIWKMQQLLTCTEDSKVKEVKNAREALQKGLFHGYHALRRLEDYQLC